MSGAGRSSRHQEQHSHLRHEHSAVRLKEYIASLLCANGEKAAVVLGAVVTAVVPDGTIGLSGVRGGLRLRGAHLGEEVAATVAYMTQTGRCGSRVTIIK